MEVVQQVYGLSGDLRTMQRHLNDLQPSIRDPLMQSLQQMDQDAPPQPPGQGRSAGDDGGRGGQGAQEEPPPPEEEDFRTCQVCMHACMSQAAAPCTEPAPRVRRHAAPRSQPKPNIPCVRSSAAALTRISTRRSLTSTSGRSAPRCCRAASAAR